MASGHVFYVSVSGSDSGEGSVSRPFRSIQRAADVMEAGDSCVIREGVYREWVKPPRGGSSDSQRITYKAYEGERVVIKGSERVSCWSRFDGDVWVADVPDSFFGGFNPFRRSVSGKWQLSGQLFHLGEVYLDGVSYCEKLYLQDVLALPETWFVQAAASSVLIYANFAGADPNEALAEINVRECIFFPDVKGLRYITLDGLCFEHAAANWVNFTDFQHAAVGMYYGRSWIIQNCRISDAKCAGLVCGNDPSGYNEGFDLEETGHHIVRNNRICRCGEAGIHGYKGWVASLIEGNLIEDINVKRQYGGYESGGMKLHHAVDVTVKNNIVRRVYASVGGQYVGIWIDWGAQGTRITGNIVYDMDEWNGWTFFIQNSHCSPVLIDNNIFIGQVFNSARGSIFAHNMFVDSRWYFMVENMDPIYWKPHSADVAEILPLTHLGDDRYCNNIFIKKGTDQLVNAHGYIIERNVHYQGAREACSGERGSIVRSGHDAAFALDEMPDGVSISFSADGAPYEVGCNAVTHESIGVFPLTGQGLDDHYGNPVSVDTDILGTARSASRPAAGPFEKPASGRNSFTFYAGPGRSGG